jgi:hypothetical protein
MMQRVSSIKWLLKEACYGPCDATLNRTKGGYTQVGALRHDGKLNPYIDMPPTLVLQERVSYQL